MDTKPNKNLALILGKFSSLLIKEKIIDPESDQTALIKAMGSVAHNLSQPEPEKKVTLSSMEFIKGPLANLLSKHEKTQQKIEDLRKKQYLEESSHLQTKPTISSLSKQLVNNI